MALFYYWSRTGYKIFPTLLRYLPYCPEHPYFVTPDLIGGP